MAAYPAPFQVITRSLAILSVAMLLGCRPDRLESGRSQPENDFPESLLERNLARFQDPATGEVPAGIREMELAFVQRIGKHGDRVGSHSEGLLPTPIPVTDGPHTQGGRTRALAIDILDPNVLLAAGVSGGIWKSTDQGESWKRTLALDQVPLIQCLVQDARPGQENTWYACGGETRGSGNRFDLAGGGIYRSVDGGDSWSVVPAARPNTPEMNWEAFDFINGIALDSRRMDADIAVAATNGGLVYTEDGFETLEFVTFDSAVMVHFHPAIGFLAVTRGADLRQSVLFSEDGLNWIDRTPPVWNRHNWCTRIASGVGHQSLYLFSAGGGRQSLYRLDVSGDQPELWTDLSDRVPPEFDDYGCYNVAVGVDHYDPDFAFIGGIWFWRSTDGFRSDSLTKFAQAGLNYSWVHVDIHAFVFDRTDPDLMYVATDGGIYRNRSMKADIVDVESTSCTTFQCLERYEAEWQAINEGFQTTQFYTTCLDPAFGSSLIGGGTQDNGSWLGGHQGYKRIGGGDGIYCSILSGMDTVVISSQINDARRLDRQPGGYYRQVDLVPSQTNRYWFDPFTVDPETKSMFLIGDSFEIWYNPTISADDREALDARWKQIFVVDQSFRHIRVLETSWNADPTRLYIAHHDLTTGNLTRMDVRADTVQSFGELAWPTTLPHESWINSIDADTEDPDYVMIAASNYGVPSVFLSEDAGKSWRDVSGNLEALPDGSGSGPSVRSVQIVHLADGRRVHLAGTSVGMFISENIDDEDPLWTRLFDSEIGVAPIEMVETRDSDGMVAIGTHGSGLHSYSILAAAPRPLHPSDGAVDLDPNAVTFSWLGPVGATRFSLQVATDSLFEEIKFGASVLDSSTTVRLEPGRYYWRVESDYGETKSPWSARRSFETLNIGLATLEHTVPSANLELSVYPNPFSDFVAVRATAPAGLSLRLEVYDLLGRSVATLTDREVGTTGELSLTWSAEHLASGSYILLARTESSSESLLVVKK